jgi:hypothetical protein
MTGSRKERKEGGNEKGRGGINALFSISTFASRLPISLFHCLPRPVARLTGCWLLSAAADWAAAVLRFGQTGIDKWNNVEKEEAEEEAEGWMKREKLGRKNREGMKKGMKKG